MTTALERDAEAYINALPDLLNKHRGEFVLIRAGDVVQFFASYEDALKAGYQRFKREPFFVKEVAPVERVANVTLDLEPCRT